MLTDEILESIRYQEGLLQQLYTEKKKLEQEIDKLEKLRGKFGRLQDEFDDVHQKRTQKLNFASGTEINNKIFVRYHSGMTGLLSGHSYHKACEGMLTARDRISLEIQKLIQNLNDCQNRIVSCQNRQANLRYELSVSMGKEASV